MAGTDQEILFLIAKFLEGTPLVETFSTLEKELSSHGLLGTATDWRGEGAVVTYPAFQARFPNISNTHLLQLLQSRSPTSNGHNNDRYNGESRSLINRLPSSSSSSLLSPVTYNGSRAQCFQLVQHFRQMIISLATKRAFLRTAQGNFAAAKTIEASLISRESESKESDANIETAVESADRRKLNEMTRQVKDSQSQINELTEAIQLLEVESRQLKPDAFKSIINLHSEDSCSMQRNAGRSMCALLNANATLGRRKCKNKDIKAPCSKLLADRLKPVKLLNGHGQQEVFCVCFDQSGRFVITGADDTLIKVWEMKTALLTMTLRGHVGYISDLCVSPNNAILASVDTTYVIRIWELSTGVPLAALAGHTGSVNYIRFDPMNGYLYSASDDCTLRVWDVQGVNSTDGEMSELAWRDDVKHVSIQVENEQMGKAAELKSVSIHPYGGMVALGCSDNIARIWTTVTSMDVSAEKKCSLSGHTMPVTDVCWSNKGDRLATASTNDGTVRCWRWHDHNFRRIDHTVLRINQGSTGGGSSGSGGGSRGKFARPSTASIQVDAVVWTCDDKLLITSEIKQTSRTSVCTDQAIKLWDSFSGCLLKSFPEVHSGRCGIIMPHPIYPSVFITAAYDGRICVFGGSDNPATPNSKGYSIFNHKAEDSHSAFSVHRPGDSLKILDGSFSEDGQYFALGDQCGGLLLGSAVAVREWTKAPPQQFFATDYAEISLDSSHRAMDVTSQLAPHLTPRGELCNLDLIPHIMQPAEDCVIPVFSCEEMREKGQLLKEKSKFLNVYLETLHSNLQLQHQRASRMSEYRSTKKTKKTALKSPVSSSTAKKWITIDSDGEDINADEGVMDEEYDEVGGGEEDDSSEDDLEDSDPEDWGSRRRTNTRSSRGSRLGGGGGGGVRSSRNPTRFTSRSTNSVNYRQGNVDDSGSDGYDSEDMMNNVSFDSEQAKVERSARLEKRQRQVLQSEGAKKSKKTTSGGVVVEEVSDVFDSDIIASLEPSSHASSSTMQVLDRSGLICALCGGGHSESDELPGVLLGKHPLKMASKRVWIHDNCALFSPEVYCLDNKWYHLAKAVRRGEQLKCSGCGKFGATLGCTVTTCRFNYHIPCAHEKTQWEMFTEEGEIVPFFCTKHRKHFKEKKSKKSKDQGKVWPAHLPLERDWLLNTKPQRGIGSGDVYTPQVGDIVVYFGQGHQAYLANHPEKNSPPYMSFSSRFAMVECEVMSVNYSFPHSIHDPHSIVAITTMKPLRVAKESRSAQVEWTPYKRNTRQTSDADTFELDIRSWNGAEFVVLAHVVQESLKVSWREGMKFTNVQTDANGSPCTYKGTVVKVLPRSSPDWTGCSLWDTLRVKWDEDGGEEEEDCLLGPWEAKLWAPTSSSSSSLSASPYFTSSSSSTSSQPFNNDGSDLLLSLLLDETLCRKLAAFVQDLRQDELNASFSTPVSIAEVPTYFQMIPLPIDLSLIEQRLLSRYYRSLSALLFDAHLLYENCRNFNKKGSQIIKLAEKIFHKLDTFVYEGEYGQVQCDKCSKWRRIPNTKLDSLPEVWFCDMNDWDEHLASCDAAEEDPDQPQLASSSSLPSNSQTMTMDVNEKDNEGTSESKLTALQEEEAERDSEEEEEFEIDKSPIAKPSTKKRKQTNVSRRASKRHLIDEEEENESEEEEEEEEEEEYSRRPKRGSSKRSNKPIKKSRRDMSEEEEEDDEEEEEEEERYSSRSRRKPKQSIKTTSRPKRSTQVKSYGDDEDEEEEDEDDRHRHKRQPVTKSKNLSKKINEKAGGVQPNKNAAVLSPVECDDWPEWKEPGQDSKELQRICTCILRSLSKVDEDGTFSEPVPLDLVPGYDQIIPEKMDLGTMESKVSGGEYSCLEEFRYDLKLVINNCLTFNEVGSLFYNQAVDLGNAVQSAYEAAIVKGRRSRR